MKKLLIALLVTGVILAGGCAEVATPEQGAPAQIIENITPREAFTLIQDNEDNPDFAIIDVRTPEEFAEGHVEDAIIIDFYSESFRRELDTLDKNKTYLIYCQSGNRSGKALKIMVELGFKEVYNMSGGIID
ncbi:rhodanese-like domain-containing protein [Chloroflexota bacterium]